MEYILLDIPFNLILIIAREWNDLQWMKKSDKALCSMAWSMEETGAMSPGK